MEIRPAIRVLHGNRAHEYYVVEVKNDKALLIRTDSKLYNDGKFFQAYPDGRDKPYYPYWANISDLYFKLEELL